MASSGHGQYGVVHEDVSTYCLLNTLTILFGHSIHALKHIVCDQRHVPYAEQWCTFRIPGQNTLAILDLKSQGARDSSEPLLNPSVLTA